MNEDSPRVEEALRLRDTRRRGLQRTWSRVMGTGTGRKGTRTLPGRRLEQTHALVQTSQGQEAGAPGTAGRRWLRPGLGGFGSGGGRGRSCSRGRPGQPWLVLAREGGVCCHRYRGLWAQPCGASSPGSHSEHGAGPRGSARSPRAGGMMDRRGQDEASPSRAAHGGEAECLRAPVSPQGAKGPHTGHGGVHAAAQL